MPADPNYPERGMYAGGQGGGTKWFEFAYKLPDGMHGDRVMLQWKYITANSCSPPGYKEYFQRNPSLPNSYWTPGEKSYIDIQALNFDVAECFQCSINTF